MVKKLAAAALCALALGACSPLSLTTSTDGTRSLMRPPTLSVQQEQVKNALGDALGTDNYKLKYPSSGQHRSAFTFHDVDGDSVEEALAFYTLDGDDSGTAHMAILDNSGPNGAWVCVANDPGMGTDVVEVRFANLTGTGGVDILVGWQSTTASQNTVSAYRFGQGQLKTTLAGSRYLRLVVDDLTGDQVDDLLLVASTSNGRRLTARLVRPGSTRLEIGSEAHLNQNFTEILSIQSGMVTDTLPGVVIEGLVGDDTVVSDVVAVEGGSLLVPMGTDTEGLLYQQSARAQRVFARDINGDGVLELPFQTPLPGYEKATGTDQLLLTEYRALHYDASPDTEGSITVVPVYTAQPAGWAYVDLENSYLLKFPPAWAGQVTAAVQPRSGETKFFAYRDNLDDQSVELLRIRCYSQTDYQDKNESEQYVRLTSRGAFEYYAYVHSTPGNPLAVTQDQLKTLFVLL